MIKSFAKPSPRPSESPGPAYKELEPSPSPSPSVSPSATPTPVPSPSPTQTLRPTPTPTPTASPTSSPTIAPTPTPTPTREPRPELPPVPPVEDPKNVIFVVPNEPVVVTSKELTGIPNTPIEIVTEPKYGTAEVQNNGNLVYTSNLTDPKSTVVDVVEYKFTNLSGAVVVARKEFVLEQSGDVPRIIQTGSNGASPLVDYSLIFLLVGASIFIAQILKRDNGLGRRKK